MLQVWELPYRTHLAHRSDLKQEQSMPERITPTLQTQIQCCAHLTELSIRYARADYV